MSAKPTDIGAAAMVACTAAMLLFAICFIALPSLINQHTNVGLIEAAGLVLATIFAVVSAVKTALDFFGETK